MVIGSSRCCRDLGRFRGLPPKRRNSSHSRFIQAERRGLGPQGLQARWASGLIEPFFPVGHVLELELR